MKVCGLRGHGFRGCGVRLNGLKEIEIKGELARPNFYSLCSTTITPMRPSRTVFNHGCSDSKIVT